MIAEQINADGTVYFKVFVKPLVNLIWLAGLVFLLGSLIALWPDAREERRLALRYGALDAPLASVTSRSSSRRCSPVAVRRRRRAAVPARAGAERATCSTSPTRSSGGGCARRGARPGARRRSRSSSSTTAPARSRDEDYRALVGPLRREAAEALRALDRGRGGARVEADRRGTRHERSAAGDTGGTVSAADDEPLRRRGRSRPRADRATIGRAARRSAESAKRPLADGDVDELPGARRYARCRRCSARRLSAASTTSDSEAERRRQDRRAPEEDRARARQREGVLTSEIARRHRQDPRAPGRRRQRLARARTSSRACSRCISEARPPERALRASRRHSSSFLQRQHKAATTRLNKRVVEIYTDEPTSTISVVLESSSFSRRARPARLPERIGTPGRADRDEVRRAKGQMQEIRNATADTQRRSLRSTRVIAARTTEQRAVRDRLAGTSASCATARRDKRATLARPCTRTRRHALEHMRSLQAQSATLAARIRSAQARRRSCRGATAQPSAAGFIWPVQGVLTSGFGWRWGRMHEGIDIAVARARPSSPLPAGR